MILVGQFNEKQLRNGEDKACVATLSELQELINNRTISFDNTWVYFVEL